MTTTNAASDITAVGYAPSMAQDVADAIAATGRDMEISQWGYPKIRTDTYIYRVCADDTEIEVIRFENNHAQLTSGSIKLSHAFAGPVALAAVLEGMLEAEVA